jgi:hypothetical protein
MYIFSFLSSIFHSIVTGFIPNSSLSEAFIILNSIDSDQVKTDSSKSSKLPKSEFPSDCFVSIGLSLNQLNFVFLIGMIIEESGFKCILKLSVELALLIECMYCSFSSLISTGILSVFLICRGDLRTMLF